MKRLALSAVLGLAACAQTAPTPGVLLAPPGPLVSISFPDGAPLFGELVFAEVLVTNGDLRPIIVRSVELPGQLLETDQWLTSRQGAFRHEPVRDRYYWRPQNRGSTPVIFARGVLLPGETLSVSRWLRVRAATTDVILRYSEVDEDILWKSVYLSTSLTRFGTRRRSATEYESPSAVDITAYRRHDPGTEERYVVAPGLVDVPVLRRSFPAPTPWTGASPAAEVIAASQLGEGEVSEWSSGQAWLIRSPRDGVLEVLFETGASEHFRDVGFEVFDLCDALVREGAVLLYEEPRLPSLRETSPNDESAPESIDGNSGHGDEAEGAEIEDATDGDEPIEADVFAERPLLSASPQDILSLLREAERAGVRYHVAHVDPFPEYRQLCLRIR